MPVQLEHSTVAVGSVPIEVFAPRTSGRHPAVLILHGTFGLVPQYRGDIVSFAEALVAEDMLAVMPHYLDATGTMPGAEATAAIARHIGAWQAAATDALKFMRAHAGANAGRLGVLGFSLGAHLALRLAMSPGAGTGIKCVVDFFGPTRAPELPGDRSALPPVLIHHGTDDRLVPIEDSVSLVAELRAAGKVEGVGYRMETYPGQGHGFTGADLVTSRSSTVEFISDMV